MAMTSAQRQQRWRDKHRAENPPKEKKPKIWTEKELDAELARNRRYMSNLSERIICVIMPLVKFLENPRISEKKLNNLVKYACENIGEPEPGYLEFAQSHFPEAVLRPILADLAIGIETQIIFSNMDISHFLESLETNVEPWAGND